MDAADLAQQQQEQISELTKTSSPPLTINDSAIYCVDCEEQIPKERREAMPGCTMCIDCAQIKEAAHR